jgi:outer membrane receptor protein involved in Fe transport
MGVRGAVRNFTSENNNYKHIDSTNTDEFLKAQSSNYKFSDQVYAAYATYSQDLGKLTYQAGLRAESSFYTGELVDSAKKFNNQYPVSLFPSAFITYHLGSKSDLQLSYSRRINRPGFNQIIPYTDYSDSLNLKRGNPALKPEFTNAIELNYLLNLNRSDNILLSAYFKNSTNLITSYQVNEYSPVFNHNVIINTYENANFSYAYGSELTVKKSIKKWWDITGNVNVYNSFINSTNIQSNLTSQQLSWFGKLSTTFKMPKNFSLQLSGDYQSKTSLAMNSGGGGRWGMYGGGGGYGGMSTAQGYILPSYVLDVAIKKEFLKNKAASLTLNFSDILATRVNATHSETDFFVQNTSRKRDQQFFRINFNYRFGKFDVSLFKRKNTKVNTEGMDLGM